MISSHGTAQAVTWLRTFRLGVLLAASLFSLTARADRRPANRSPRPPIQVPVANANDPLPPPPRLAKVDALAAPGSESVALFEYRSDAKQLTDLVERLTQAMTQNTSLGVITLVEARRRLGSGVDSEVARCDGETGCLSAVAERLQVKEVLLLAVSQLGDVVLAIQRIDVKEKRVVARYADSLSAGQVLDEPRILGWLQQLYPPETFKRYGQLHVTTDTQGAQVYLNAKPRGKTPLDAPLSVLAPGSYRVLVEKPHFLTFQASVTVMPDSLVEVDAKLIAEVQQVPLYKRWYFWAGLGAGVAAVTASSLAIYYATAQPPPDMTHVPAIITFR